MRVSVLIPTLGRTAEVIDTISALEHQTQVPDEIIVVDQNQPELPALTQYLATQPRVKHLRFLTSGVPLNYNRALAAATGDIALYLDDDVIPAPQLIERHVACYQGNPSIIGVAGRVEQAIGDILPEKIRAVGTFYRWSARLKAHFNALQAQEVQFAQGANMSFLRSAMLQADGFDLGFAGNGYFFETDFCLRVRSQGKIWFEPEASLKHLMAPTGGARVPNKARHTRYFIQNGIRLARRHSPAVAQPFILGRFLGYLLIKALYHRNLDLLREGCRGLLTGCKSSAGAIGLSSAQQNQP